MSEHHEFGLTCGTHGGKVATSIGGVWHRGNTCGMETVLTHRVCGNSLCGRDGKKWQLCDREWSWQRFDLFWKWVGSLNLDTLELTVLWAAAITVAQGARVEGQTETMSDEGF